mmetsp:Transcript_8638/g.17501  ORF Transcript_8638/g.17501 Transcript_8638/m.17501 type:complete len:93 (-) Transcript_8638:1157-1435(-)
MGVGFCTLGFFVCFVCLFLTDEGSFRDQSRLLTTFCVGVHSIIMNGILLTLRGGWGMMRLWKECETCAHSTGEMSVRRKDFVQEANIGTHSV